MRIILGDNLQFSTPAAKLTCLGKGVVSEGAFCELRVKKG